ncbi:AarF/ABC1/UbiB kinase family protein [Streptomyces sp. FH025]|uniref:ABC1 kinase family protein n=1 Tax=Streptomyces sp. FH025 TaxID=2815937 RepID=UPI001A9D37F7|nr:AarF/ABC1/UbiB kinase family protein [Streptomyces sp. FH025]MBO1416100.1 AarF/ABC1/UbiB kinase family protein [Streptomyces sp. FH025]
MTFHDPTPEDDDPRAGDGTPPRRSGQLPVPLPRSLADRLPTGSAHRTARLLALPAGYLGRSALRTGKRLVGRPTAGLTEQIQRRTAEQLFATLGELKGGAMKFGQLLSVFEAALPPELVAPYRAALTRLQDAAPALPAVVVRRVLAAELGADWRSSFREFDEQPAAAASIGQVHRAVWRDGRPVAVKIQYPGAREALLGDYARLSRLIRLLSVFSPALELGPMLAELRDRITEELDYRREAASQRAFAEAYRDDPDIHVPDVVTGTAKVLVTDWLPGTPLARLITDGTQDERNAAGLRYIRFLLSGPARARRLHADPHPGNFRVLTDGRLGVLDFGAVKDMPDGFPRLLGTLQRHAHAGDDAAAVRLLRAEGFLTGEDPADLAAVSAFLAPLAVPSATPTYRFTRAWLREQFEQTAAPDTRRLLRRLNLPPAYVLVNRVVSAGSAVLCQLECEVPYRAEAARWLPGFVPPNALPAGRT